jgi:hypothetical protein
MRTLMMMLRLAVASSLSLKLLGTIQKSCGYTPSTNNNNNDNNIAGKSRRDALASGVVGVFSLVMGGTAIIMPANGATTANGVLSSKYCASGVGEGCTDLSEGNDLIRSLQEKSALNREKYARVCQTRLICRSIFIAS